MTAQPGFNKSFCPRKKCWECTGLNCYYPHDCRAMTLAEKRQWDARIAEQRERLAEQARQAELDERRVSNDRKDRLDAMLQTYGLSLYDLEEWVKEITR